LHGLALVEGGVAAWEKLVADNSFSPRQRKTESDTGRNIDPGFVL